MTHDRTQPPNDELMGKVVAKWKGWDDNVPVSKGLWNDSHMLVQGEPPYDNATEDPRSDTDAALELLGHVSDVLWASPHLNPNGWTWNSWDAQCLPPRKAKSLPISGEPFRRGVCWLAVDVLGVG